MAGNPIGQIVFGVLLVIVLLGMAGFFAWRQWLTLRSLSERTDLSTEDRKYTRHQAWRRLACSALMVMLAGLLAAHFALEPSANELLAEGQQNQEQGKPQPLTPQQQGFVSLYAIYWTITLLVLLAIIALAGVDFFAIRRYGMRHYSKIQADRRAMIEGELIRLRSQKNGHS